MVAVTMERQSCGPDEFYDIFYYKCVPCGQWESDSQTKLQTFESGFCKCKGNFKQTGRLNCIECSESKQATVDQLRCANCLDTHCDLKCEKNEILVDRELNGTVIPRNCVLCEDGTNPNKEKLGKIPVTVRARCEPCLQDPLNSSQLICPPCTTGYLLIENECFQSSKLISDSNQHLFKITYDNGKVVESKLLHETLRQTAYKCQYYNSPQACSALLNLCTLQFFNSEINNSPCQIYTNTQKNLDDSSHKNADRFILPPIFESENSIRTKSDIPTTFSFDFKDQNSVLPLKLARYAIDGRLISVDNATPSALQICPAHCTTSFAFGSWFSQSCSIKANLLWKFEPTEFYELFIEYSEETTKDNQQSRRFFIVDNESGISGSTNNKAEVIRYANLIHVRIQLDEDNIGKIFPPVLIISYKDVRLDEYENDLEVSFKISYWMNQNKINEDVTVAICVFSVLAIILSALQTWSWSKRSGRIAIDLYALVKMIFYLCDNLSNAFLLVFYLVSVIRLIFYKEQRVPSIIAPTKDQEQSFHQYIIAAFCLKCLNLIHHFYMHTNIDIFFIDWERPHLTGQGDPTQKPVSIWRNYYIAKEWRKLLIFRKTNTALNLLVLMFFLKVLKIENIALLKHNSTPSNGCEPFSQIFRFALAVSFYFLAALLQVTIQLSAYFRLIRDNFIGDTITRFIDLCSICNVSVLVLAFNQFGYYIHGRSVHGHADTDMKQFNEHLKREEDNLCSQRGLVANTSLQCFTVFITREFRQQFNKIHLPAITVEFNFNFDGIALSGRSHLLLVANSFSKLGSLSEQFILSYQTMNKFLSAFIDHALQDLDYIIKNKLATEKMLNIEFQEPTDVSFFITVKIPASRLLNPENSFTNILFYGHELDFLVWEILLLSLIDIITGDFLLSAIITIMSYKILEKIYQNKAKWNTANKTVHYINPHQTQHYLSQYQ
uniref:Meckelin n=1 Tax=Strigamia maritima TaxID=126957 RepID=T1IRZ4_STRMM